MTLCHEDGKIVGSTALDAVAKVSEHYGQADLLLVRVELVVEGDAGIRHVVSESRGHSSRAQTDDELTEDPPSPG
jgi:hypothetical protein